MAITLRPITLDDEAFLFRVYASTRAAELAQIDWDDAQKDAFLKMQFYAQHKHYVEQFRRASFDVLLLDDLPVGRLYVDRREAEIHIIDIALLPEYQRHGIGTALLTAIMQEAGQSGRFVSIYVERFNPARRLYARLGFTEVEHDDIYDFMKWLPSVETARRAQGLTKPHARANSPALTSHPT